MHYIFGIMFSVEIALYLV